MRERYKLGIMIIVGLIVGIFAVLMTLQFSSAYVWGQTNAYDTMIGTNINQTLWQNISTCTSGCSWSIDQGVTTAGRITGQGRSTQVNTIAFPDYSKVENISFNSRIYSNPGPSLSYAGVSVFGTYIKNCRDSEFCDQDNLWTIKRTSNGNFQYYKDGVLQGTLTPSNNIILMYSEYNNAVPGASALTNIGNLNWTMANNTLTISNIAPSSNQYIFSGNQITFNASLTTTNGILKNASLYIDGLQNLTQTITGTSNNSIFYQNITTIGNHNWSVYSCDSDGNCIMGGLNNLQIIPFVINSVNYSNPTYETSHETLSISYQWPSLTILSAQGTLVYNGTSYTATSTCVSGNCTSSVTLDIPIINDGSAQQNKTFYWILTAFTGSSYSTLQTQIYNQSVNQLLLTPCNSGTIAINFTAYDEQSRSRLNPFDFDGNFQYYTGTGQTFKTLNITNHSVAEVALCINQPTTYYINSIIAYSAPSYTTTGTSTTLGNASTSTTTSTAAVSYVVRNYFHQAYSINNVVQLIPLYLLKKADSTSFILQVQDPSLIGVPGVLVNAQKCYAGGTAETVFISRTDTNGLTTGNLESDVTLYQFLITNQSQTLLYVPCATVTPQSSPATLTFVIGQGYTSPFLNINNVTGITSTFIYNKTSHQTVFTYIDTSSNFTLGELYVYNLNASGTNALNCYSNSTLSSAVITCNVTTPGSYSGQAYVYRNGQVLIDQIVFTVENFSSVAGYYGAFLGFLIIIVCAFAFKWNEIAGIWLVVAACVLCNFIGLIAFGLPAITGIICIAIVITGVLGR